MVRRGERRKPPRLRLAPFARFVGLRIVSVSRGRVVLEVEVRPHHHNPAGVVHGGALFTLLDTAMGATLRTVQPPGRPFAATEIHIRYLEPVVRGTVRGEARIVRLGRSIAVMEAVARQGRREVARASASFYLNFAPRGSRGR